jgi:acetylornithine deacetylase/succinyl-diaminopimelate desuccinylase-like protein
VLLLAHLDVVGVERERWSVDPFAGEIREGWIYGRGAIDDKGMLAANLEAMLLLKRHVVDADTPLARDVVVVASADEEHGGEWGIDWLIEHHPELLRAELALNEGGRIRIVGGRPVYAAVQNAEKVPHTLIVTAHGRGGHAAVPLPDNAILRLGRALAAIGAHEEPVTMTPTTRAFFGELAGVWPVAAEAEAMRDVAADDPERIARGAARLSETPVFAAVLRNGISPTVIHGGSKSNVIPTEASATLNVRTLPGEPIDDVVARLAAAVDDPRVTIAVRDRGLDAPASSFASPMFTAIADTVRALAPTLVTVPYLSTGATDSAKLRAWGVQAYGLLPFPMDESDESRMHAADERVSLSSLGFGVELIFGVIWRVSRQA